MDLMKCFNSPFVARMKSCSVAFIPISSVPEHWLALVSHVQ